MNELITISARHLGSIALPHFCPRCFWIRSRLNWHGPWEVFPSIFSKLDRAQKHFVEGHIDEHGVAPEWMKPLGNIVKYVNPPGYTTFFTIDTKSHVLVRGTADGIMVRKDGSVCIIDYKTAKPKGSGDGLAAEYMVQLNTYALAAERLGHAPVTDLALIYLQPLTDPDTMTDPAYALPWGFSVPFRATIHPVPLDAAVLPPLCATVREICEMTKPPAGREKCRDCETVDKLIIAAGGNPTKATASTALEVVRGFFSTHFGAAGYS